MSKKYYILKKNNPQMMDDYFRDIIKNKEQVRKQIKETDQLLLIEKTQMSDNEYYTNMWTMNEGTSILWEKHTKGRMMYDYTGVVHPLIHRKGKVVTWEQYLSEKNCQS